MIYRLFSPDEIIDAVKKFGNELTIESKERFLNFIQEVVFNEPTDRDNARDLILRKLKLLKRKVDSAFIDDAIFAVNEIFDSFKQSEPPQPKQKRDTEIEKLNWQGTQAQLVFLIEQLYEQGFLSSIIQPEKFSLLSQHFTVKGNSLNPKTLSQTRQNSLNTKKGKPKAVEKIEQIISAAKKQNP